MNMEDVEHVETVAYGDGVMEEGHVRYRIEGTKDLKFEFGERYGGESPNLKLLSVHITTDGIADGIVADERSVSILNETARSMFELVDDARRKLVEHNPNNEEVRVNI